MFGKNKLKPLTNPQVGSKCVVREGVDTPIYSVKSLDSSLAELTYVTSAGKLVNGGTMPLSVLYEPTEAQLANDALIKRIYK